MASERSDGPHEERVLKVRRKHSFIAMSEAVGTDNVKCRSAEADIEVNGFLVILW